jgi:hypothetical protein
MLFYSSGGKYDKRDNNEKKVKGKDGKEERLRETFKPTG